jgi:hypothetical protein
VSAVLGVDGGAVNEAEIGFVDECGAAESVIRALPLKVAVGEVVEFPINQRDESLEGI